MPFFPSVYNSNCHTVLTCYQVILLHVSASKHKTSNLSVLQTFKILVLYIGTHLVTRLPPWGQDWLEKIIEKKKKNGMYIAKRSQ